MNLRVILVILSFLAILATALGINYSYLSLVKSTISAAHREAQDETKMVAIHIDSIIAENQKLVRVLAGHDEITKALIKKDPDALLKANSILNLFHRSLDVNVCYLMDSDGNIIASSNRNDPNSFVSKNYSFRPYFQKAIGGNPSVYMALGVTSKKRELYVGHPVYENDKDTPVGIAVIKSSLTQINDELAHSNDGIISIASPHGLVFVSNNKGVLNKLLWQVSEDTTKEIEDSGQFGKGPWNRTGMFTRDHEHDNADIEDTENAYDNTGVEYRIHEENINRYSGWKVVYLHEEKAVAQRISAPIFKTSKAVGIVLLLITVLFVSILYKKASDELTTRKKLEEKLKDMSITDDLTGIYNRRGFFELARHEFHTAIRNKSLMSLFYLDIDNMKNINDKYGHSEGNNALVDLAEILKTNFRKSDILARLGGDEFVVLSILMVRDADHKSENIVNRIEKTLNDHNHSGKRPFQLSVSIGEVTYDPEMQVDFENFVQMADRLMYEQKKKKEIAQ